MTLEDLVNAVYARGYLFTQTADDDANPTKAALNATYRLVCGSQRWPFLAKSTTLATTTAGTQGYPLSTVTDFMFVEAVRITDSQGNGYDLEAKDAQEFKSATVSDTSTGLPQWWAEFGGDVLLWPTPDAAYTVTLDYYYQPPDLEALTDVPVLPLVYHDILVWGAIMELGYRERDYWDSNLAAGNYQQRYSAMLNEYLLRQRQSSARVKRSGFYDDTDWNPIGWGIPG